MKNRNLTLVLFLVCDLLIAEFSLAISLVFTHNSIFFNKFDIVSFSYLAWPILLLLILYILKVYNILWSHSGLMEILRISASAFFSIFGLVFAQFSLFGRCFDSEVIIILLFLSIVLIYTSRLIFKKLTNIQKFIDFDESSKLLSGNIMLIGAGSAGEMIINEFTSKPEYSKCKIKCVIDDDQYKRDKYICGIRIIGGRELIVSAAEKYDISTIVFAIPNCDSDNKSAILDLCQKTSCKLKVVPSVCRLYNISEISHTLREVQIEDLLGRDPIDLTNNIDLQYLNNKVVLVTGGGGSIGSELCRQIASVGPAQLIIFDIYENNAYDIQNELHNNFPNLKLVTLIGSVRDSNRLDSVFKTYKPQIVFHAAAHKHVPLMEDSPNETIKNNVFGTLKTANCAAKYGAEKFVLISTDKAVNPTNIMGASKRICEMIVQSCNKNSETDFVAVRFGNVLGSNGSVIPVFKNQIAHGGPVTVTDPNIIRYFMTIPEAVSLVLEAGSKAHGGEIFVLDMGKPVKILTLAENLIKLSGYVPYKDIQIQFTGLRPGEKLFEELLMSEEGLETTDNSLIYIGQPIDIDENLLFDTLDKMKAVMYDDSADVRALVSSIVPTYKPKK